MVKVKKSMLTQIKFGTSGWRAVVAEEFTCENVRRASTGIARFIASRNPQGKVVVGRDPRFMGETFCKIAADVLSAHGVTPLLIPDPAPTPAISYAVTQEHADGSINITASHNPPEYNGIKFSTADGAPALPEFTEAIEAEIAAADQGKKTASTVKPAPAQPLHPREMYLKRLREVVDFAAIKKAGLKVVFDPFWGAGRGYSDSLLREAGVTVATVHDYRDVLFGGHAPEPDDHLLGDLRQKMKETQANVGIATDGDADRFGIVDQDGTYFQPNFIIALLFDYLVESRGWKNGVAKSVATTNLVNALAKYHDIELHETPVGFKYIGELIKADKIALGGEESAGLSIRHHVAEKDGIVAGLLMCEMVAVRRKSLSQQLTDLFVKVGSLYPQRDNFRLTPEVKAKFTSKLGVDPRDFCGRTVKQIVRKDGLKLLFEDGSWVCYRLSGTEPVVRVYSEACSQSDLKKLSEAAQQWIFE
ncbi:MAG: phosphoglucomutase/phosphomannomutase family protein [Terriglobales bacterium]|jgi:alpha-D-glucose phosphate-specific phosphoglucomutase